MSRKINSDSNVAPAMKHEVELARLHLPSPNIWLLILIPTISWFITVV
ncbi:MAG: hypothetical protein HLUCCA11_05350 [Phormidesmis priestleyi Ana]|uniref:Uncharacterized protein n=1 Tax=Phormidesmis priestleyi Ana TaxID=1666911 RepID=A0A0P7YZ35_9CYAN|nr:MAG: hypothetical protein HLUCCA11_05350 [Phormidesmis priestleyi Ana]